MGAVSPILEDVPALLRQKFRRQIANSGTGRIEDTIRVFSMRVTKEHFNR